MTIEAPIVICECGARMEVYVAEITHLLTREVTIVPLIATCPRCGGHVSLYEPPVEAVVGTPQEADGA